MSRKQFYFFFSFLLICTLISAAFTWGFFSHKKINRLAVFTLPPEMFSFYKKNIDYITERAVDADRRRGVVADEACRHYIDADHYGLHPFDSIPPYWKDAVAKYTEDTLKEYGIVPWYAEKMIYRLTEAFKDQDVNRILYLSANLGHYVADAHVPLHTTKNYNGQLTGQQGIHGFWESRLPELFSEEWDFFTGRAKYIKSVNKEIWKIVRESYEAKDSVLLFEAELNKKWEPDKKYSFENNKKVYSVEYSRAYNEMLSGMVERRMHAAVHAVGSFWYTAWVNAGKPNLDIFLDKELADSLKREEKEIEKMWKTGKPIKGHED